MTQTRQILRLRHEGVSIREFGRRMAVARSTVQDTLKRAAQAGLCWPLPEALSDAVLGRQLFACAATQLGARRRAEADWARLALELKRPGVTLTVLWDESRAVHPDGFGYSRISQPVLGFREAAVAGDAPAPPAGRQAVRRFLRQDPFDRRPGDGRGSAGADLRGGAGRLEPEPQTEADIDPSVETVADSCDNALAECIIGLFKTEVINALGPWKTTRDVERQTLKWIDWYNNRRLLAPIGYIPPAEAEQAYFATTNTLDQAA